VLQQQRDDQVLLVVEVAQEVASEIDMGIVETRELGVELGAVGVLRHENDVRALDDAADRGVQRRVVALEQLEAGREARLRPPEHGKVMEILDLVVLLEAAGRPAQMLDSAPEREQTLDC
jgi:hypothetical protein